MEKNLSRPLLNLNLQSRLDFLIEIVLIILLAVSPFLLGSVGPFGITLVEAGAFLILFLWIIKRIGEGSIDFIHIPINKPLCLFLLFILAQHLFIDYLTHYEFQLGEVYRQKIKSQTVKLASYLIYFYIVLNNFYRQKNVRKLVFSLIVIGFALSFFGTIQKLSAAKGVFWTIPPKGTEKFFASFPNRNHFANYINMVIFLTLGVIFSRFPDLRNELRGFDRKRVLNTIFATFQKGLWLYMTVLIVMASSLFYSLSRGGMFAFVCGLLFFSFLVLAKGLTKRGYIFLFLILLFTSGLLLWIDAPSQIMQRFSEVDKPRAPLAERVLGGRKILADKGIEMIKGYPLLGVGLGAFEFIYNEKYSPRIKYVNTYYYIDHLHNDFLEFFCEVGSLGFIIFFITALVYILFILKILFKRRDPFAVGVGIGAMAGLFSMCVHSLFDFNFHITSNALLFFVVAGLGIVVVNSKIEDEKETTLLIRTRPLALTNLFTKFLLIIMSGGVFFCAVKLVIAPYIAYSLAQNKDANIVYLKKAIRLDPLNDRYHFMLSRFFIEEAKRDKDRSQEYAGFALSEIKEASRLNPWNKYYPEYLEWLVETFRQ